jgi:peptidoglycan/xylan/chitin deacetylase (PgdA/CDA1 family)
VTPYAQHGRRVVAAACVLIAVACTGTSGAGATTVSLSTETCTIVGTGGDDQLVGTPGDDVICGLGGADVIASGAGDDLIDAGTGSDVAKGGRGADRIVGGPGDDVLGGGRGADNVRGQDGNDRVDGGVGLDRVFGGDGTDRVSVRDQAPYDIVDGGTGMNLCIADASDHRARCKRPLIRHPHGVPILMYHVIQAPPPGVAFPQLYVEPEVFAAQMRWLADHHYHVVTLQEVYDAWHGAPLPSRPIVVSFDDGFGNQYTKATPILARHGWAGTLNLALSHFDQPGWGLGPKAIQHMIHRGWEVDSHTMTHPYLPGLSADALAYEIGHSRSVIRRRFHIPVNFFCYPGGAYNSTVITAVRQAGYLAATSTQSGIARSTQMWTLDRIRVSHGDGVSGLASHLRALGMPG